MTTITCDVCHREPSPNVPTQLIDTPVQLGQSVLNVSFTFTLDLCHDCRNQALRVLSERYGVAEKG